MVAKVSTYSEYHHPLPIRKRSYMDSNGPDSPPLEVTANTTTAVQQKVSLSMVSFNPWPGQFNFQLKCQEPSDRCPSHARSDLLEKIFVQKDVPLVIETSIAKGNKHDDFTVRAAAVYSRPSEVHEPVKRCLNHSSKDQYTSNGVQNTSSNHFIWSDYPKSVYEEDPSTGRLSVLTPLFEPQPGSEQTLLVYRFMCLNSCISRRPIRIVFSLEKNNKVVGSHSIDVRVCACPARDLSIEEKRHLLKRSRREDVYRTSPLRGGSPSSSDEPISMTRTNKRSRAVEEEDEIQMLPIKGQKMTEIMKFLLERLMLAEKCLQVHPELMDEVKRETEELSHMNPHTQKKKSKNASSRATKLSTKLADIQVAMSVEPPLTQPLKVRNVNSKPVVTVPQAERTQSYSIGNMNSIPTITGPGASPVSVASGSYPVSYTIPTTSVALVSSGQPGVSTISEIKVKEEPI